MVSSLLSWVYSNPYSLHSCDRIMSSRLLRFIISLVMLGPKQQPPPRKLFAWTPGFFWGSLHNASRTIRHLNRKQIKNQSKKEILSIQTKCTSNSSSMFMFSTSSNLSLKMGGLRMLTYFSRLILAKSFSRVRSEMPPCTTYLFWSMTLANGSQLNASLNSLLIRLLWNSYFSHISFRNP